MNIKNEDRKIYILGDGGMAREVYTIYLDLGSSDNVIGFVIGNGYNKRLDTIYDTKVLHEKELSINSENNILIGAIGNPLRKIWIESLEQKNWKFDKIIHPNSKVGVMVKIGEGSILCYGVVLTCDISIGKHSIVNVNALIHHDCKIGDFVTIGPSVNIAGNVVIGDGCFIGMGATIIQDVTIGNGVCIGAGAVVTKDIPDNTLALGVPAKVIKKLSKEDWINII